MVGNQIVFSFTRAHAQIVLFICGMVPWLSMLVYTANSVEDASLLLTTGPTSGANEWASLIGPVALDALPAVTLLSSLGSSR